MTTQENVPPHYLDAHAIVRPDKPALICGERALTYSQLNDRARRLANALQGLGVRSRDRVAVMAHNSIEALETAAAASKIAAINLTVNYRLREREVAYVLNDSESRAIVVGPDLIQVVEGARPEVQGDLLYIAIGGEAPTGWLHYEELIANGSPAVPQSESSTGSTMSYTSGTTGYPKGAYRPHGVPASDLLPVVQAFGLTESDVHLLAGPYYHSAPNFFAGIHLLLGSTLVIMPRFDPVEALRLIDTYKVTTTFVAPTLLLRMCEVPADTAATCDIGSLRQIIVAGAPCPYALKVKSAQRFGEVLWEFYGATETGIVTILRPEDQLRKPGSCGQAAPGHEIRLLDDEGNPVPDGTPGEFWVRNRWLAEYYKKPEATAKNMRDGFFSVGDIAYRDEEGYYYICDRRVDMVISGGVNIYPAEIEAVLTAHPAVADVAVIGVPDEHWGESVKAIIALRPGMQASADELIAFCSERLADYKRPRSIDFVDELPRSPSGKLLKNIIRKPYWEAAGRNI